MFSLTLREGDPILSHQFIHNLQKLWYSCILKINQANFLVVINTEETLPQSYISQLLNIRGGSVTKALKRLEAKGLVEINPNPENKSKNIVKITDKGRKTTKEFKCIIENIENEIFEKYNDKEKEKLKIMLRDIAKEYDNLT